MARSLTPWIWIGGFATLAVTLRTLLRPALAEGQVRAVRTPRTKSQARAELHDAFVAVAGHEPTAAQLSMLVAQSAYETGNWTAMWNWSWSNITTTSSPWYTLGQEKTVGPHHYRPFSSAIEGATYYVSFLQQHYPDAWSVLGSGDTLAFAQALKNARFYETDVNTYAAGLNQHYA